METSGAAVQSPRDRQAGADHRCAVRGRSQPPGEGRPAGDDRGDQRQRRAGTQCRSAEWHQWHHRCCDGRGDRGYRDHHLLPAQARAFVIAGPDSLRPRPRRRYRDRCRRARGNSAAGFRKHSASLAQIVSGAADRRPEIQSRPRGRGLRRYRCDRRGAAVGARRVAGRRRAGHAGLAEGCARRQCRGTHRRHGSPDRHRGRVCRTSVGQAPERPA